MLLKRFIWTVGCFLGRGLAILAFSFRCFHADRLPRSGGVIVVSNHQSYLDPIMVGLSLGRMTCFMARRSLFRNPLFGALLRALNTFPISRGTADKRAVRKAVDRLEAGWCLVMFPEGTRTRDGSIGRLHGGVTAIARRARVPVTPVVLDGAFDVWPRHGVPRLHPIRVAFGRTIPPEVHTRMERDAFVGLLQDTFAQLQAELRSRTGDQDLKSM